MAAITFFAADITLFAAAPWSPSHVAGYCWLLIFDAISPAAPPVYIIDYFRCHAD